MWGGCTSDRIWSEYERRTTCCAFIKGPHPLPGYLQTPLSACLSANRVSCRPRTKRANKLFRNCTAIMHMLRERIDFYGAVARHYNIFLIITSNQIKKIQQLTDKHFSAASIILISFKYALQVIMYTIITRNNLKQSRYSLYGNLV